MFYLLTYILLIHLLARQFGITSNFVSNAFYRHCLLGTVNIRSTDKKFTFKNHLKTCLYSSVLTSSHYCVNASDLPMISSIMQTWLTDWLWCCTYTSGICFITMYQPFLIWIVDCMQFLSENRLNGCHIFGWLCFLTPNPNRFSVFRIPLNKDDINHSL